MNSHLTFRLLGVVAVLTPLASAQPDRAVPPSGSPPSSIGTAARPLTFAEAQQLLARAKKYEAHPDKGGDEGKPSEPQPLPSVFSMESPPPAPKTEGKPLAPGPDLVWVDGHYMPVENQWRWVTGAWAKPATPISVWIPARYDEKTKKWYPGYWEPDRVTAPPTESSAPTTPVKPTVATPPR